MNKLGKYQIRRPLGKGAMGVVYEGFDPVIERTVAIKTILPAQLNSADALDIMARFKREAQAAGRLNHPGIVAVYDYGEEIAQDVSEEDATMMAVAPASTQRIAYIAMEFVKGKELKEYLDKGDRFPLAEVARIMDEILDAMDHAHAQGVVHRDMKPANVMLLDGGRVKVADFGIARVEASELTQAGTVMGTPSYMSPEQFMGHTVDGRSDLFSCGVILYQLLTGERPFTGENTTTIMYKVLREEPAPPSALNLSLSPALDAVLAKALAKQPAQRFQNGRAFATALRTAISAQPEEQGFPAPISQPQPAMTTASQSFSVPPAAVAAPQRRAVGGWVAAGAAAIAVVAGGYLVLMPGRSGAPVVQASAPATPVATPVAIAATSAPVVVPVAPAAAPGPTEAGTLVISALGQADPQDARFGGNLAAAQTEARNDARRQLVEKALALYVDKGSLDTNYGIIEQKLLSNSGAFIRTVLQEGAPVTGKSGVIETETRAVVNIRDVQKSLNQLSREERVEFIRNKGDPRISIQIAVGGAEAATPFPK
ncbi:MAG: serine/threonine protein kinase, partial [Haliea sp.]